MISVERNFTVEFYDVDSMNVAWHGHYVKYMEIGRRALLNHIGYGYREMEASGYLWPVVTMKLKYIRPLRFEAEAKVKATLLEYENRLRMKFELFDGETLVTKAESVQMAVNAADGESLMVCPDCLISAVEKLL